MEKAEERRTAVQAAITNANSARSLFETDFETLLEFMQMIGINPVAVRAKLTELHVGKPASLCLAPEGAILRAGNWHALKGTKGGNRHVFVVVVVDRKSYEANRAKSPDRWVGLELRPDPSRDDEDNDVED